MQRLMNELLAYGFAEDPQTGRPNKLVLALWEVIEPFENDQMKIFNSIKNIRLGMRGHTDVPLMIYTTLLSGTYFYNFNCMMKRHGFCTNDVIGYSESVLLIWKIMANDSRTNPGIFSDVHDFLEKTAPGSMSLSSLRLKIYGMTGEFGEVINKINEGSREPDLQTNSRDGIECKFCKSKNTETRTIKTTSIDEAQMISIICHNCKKVNE